jgi:hypothetical protein
MGSEDGGPNPDVVYMGHNPLVPDNYEIVEPNAAALIEALRAFGYTPETAVADLIDNSITAGSSEIRIDFKWNGPNSLISIIDNGEGMDEDTLVNAMRAGSRSPRDTREANDLGRFGLGLKTASFSQCRALTVASKNVDGEVSIRKWDLDEVEATKQWRLLKKCSPDSHEVIRRLDTTTSGTAITWENLDRIVNNASSEDETSERHFYNTADAISAHLSMTFHRLIGRGLKIYLSGQEVKKWDPFLEGNPARQVLGTEKIELNASIITVDPFVLPHRSKLTQEDFELAGGSRGWNDLQGFYVYRNNRLLVAGDWLGLRFTKEEHYKLARIRVDITNNMDDLWQIDVRKSVAIPPVPIRSELKRIALYTRQRASEVYRHRGKVITTLAHQGVVNVWNQKVKHGRIFYRINEGHVAVANALTDPTSKNIRTLIRIIEETVPVPLITISASENPEAHSAPLEMATPKQVADIALEVFQALISKGTPVKSAIERVLTTEPFNMYPELIEVLREASSTDDH